MLSGYCRAQSHALVLVSAEGKKMTVYVNRQKINERPEAIVKAYHIESGKQWIEVKFHEDELSNFSDTILIDPKSKSVNQEYTFAVSCINKKDKCHYQLKYIAVTDLSGPEKLMLPKAPIEKKPLQDSVIYGNLYSIKNKHLIFFKHFDTHLKQNDTLLSEDDVVFLQQLIENTNDQQLKYEYLMSAIENNAYSVEQAKKILGLFLSELDKLKASKEMYNHLTDPEHAKDLMESFKYKSVQQDYESYLKEQLEIDNESKSLCLQVPDEKAFQDILNEIKEVHNEADKMKQIKKKLSAQCFSCAQVDQMLMQLVHDRDKFDLLKLAYKHIKDKENFHLLENTLQFQETKNEFKQYFIR